MSRALISRPLPLAAVAVLALNDHVLKRIASGWMTGKLSDVAGLFFFPILLATLVRWIAPGTSPLKLARWSTVSTALVFASIKISPFANAIANRLLGPTVLDPSDLLALPACIAALFYLRAHDRVATSRRISRLDRIAIACAGLASMATSPIRRPPCTPESAKTPHIGWEMTCLRTEGAKIKLSGKRLELELALRPAASACFFDGRGLAVDYDTSSAHVRLHTAAIPTGAKVEQELVIQAGFELPYPTRCADLRVFALIAGSATIEVDTKVASCTETP